MKPSCTLPAWFVLAGLLAPAVLAQSGGAFRVESGSFTGGGATSKGGTFTVQGGILSWGGMLSQGGRFTLERGLRAKIPPSPDSTPCLIECPKDRTVEYGATWEFDAPTFPPGCALQPQIEVVSTKTNGLCGNSFAVSRTWKITQRDGAVTTCTQSIKVTDTTPPEIRFPADLVVTTTEGKPVPVEYVAMSKDEGDPAPTLISVPPPGSEFPVGKTVVTCTATDACGNASTASFMVTVLEDSGCITVTPPPNQVVPCAFAEGGAVHYPLPTVSNTCGGAEPKGLIWTCSPENDHGF